ncbi:MAG: hypothetical protein N4A71_06535, partial [Carboxylicivirga sp.]|nr:hypothetical protein [Carboxylicivirga sp.]
MKRLLLNCFLLLSLFTFSNQLVSGQSCVNDNYCDNDTDLLLNCPDVPTWTEYFWEVTEINGTGNPGTVIPELIRVDGTDYYFTPSNVPNGYIGVELYVVCVRGTPTNRQGQLWKSVRVRQAPSLYDLSGPADVCQGEPFTMQLANSAGVTTTYRLFSEDSGSPKGVSGGQNGAIDFNLSIPTPNTYTFYVVADDGFCSSEMPVARPSVIVNELPDLDAGADVDMCAGDPAVTLTATTSIGGATFLWSTGETTQSINVAPAATTTYTVTITNAATSCEASDDVTVTVNPLPDVDAGLDQTICFGDPTVALTATTSVGGATYLWSTGETTQTINVSPAATTTYTVTVTNPATGCEGVDNVTVNVDPLPDVDAGLDQTICFGDPAVALTATTSVGGATFLWSTGETTQTINVSPAATTVYTVTVTNPATGCDANDNVTVNVNDLPDVNAGADVAICAGDPAVTLTATTSVPTVSYLWSTGETTQSIDVAPAATTTYTVTITNTATGCSDSDDVIVTVNPLPDVDAGLDQTICFGDPAVALTATTSVGGATFLWSSGETTQTINVSPAVTTIYTVTVTNPATGCEASDIVTVNVDPLPDVDAGLDQTICFGDPAVALTATTSVGGATFLWSTGETTQTINVSPAATTIYTVTVTNPATGCEASDNVTINVNALPDVNAGADVAMCAGDPAVTLTATTSVPTVSYLWSTGETTQSIDVAPAATTTYTVTITNTSTGCEDSDDVIVTVNPLPDVNAGVDQTICLGDPAVALTATTSVGGATFLWSTGETTQTINVSPATTTTYSVTVTNPATGCEANDEVIVNVNNVTANISISAPVVGGTEICAGTTVTFNAAGVGGSGNYNYDFHRVRGAADVSVQNSTTPTYSDGALQDGDIIYVVVTDITNTCIDQSVNITMTVNANPVVSLNITNPASGSSTVCTGTNVVFTASGTYDNYEFYLNGVSVQSGASNTYSNNTLSTGDQVFVEATQGACSGSSVPPIVMTVNDLPSPTLVSDQAGNIACPAEEVTFTAGGGDLYEFFVDGISQGAAGAASEFKYIHPTNTAYNVTVIVTDGNGCIATSTPVNITFDPATAGLGADNTTICAGEDVTFTATGGVSYEFFVDGASVQGPGAEDVYVAAGLTDGQVVTV